MDGKIRFSREHINLKAMTSALLFSLAALLVFNLPDHPDAFGVGAFRRLPLEWALIGLLTLLTRGWLRQIAIFSFGFIVFLVLFLKLADIGVQSTFQRPFNPYLDLKMLKDGWNLISGTIGTPAALAALIGGLLLFLLVASVFLRALKWMAKATRSTRRVLTAVFATVSVIGAGLMWLGSPWVDFRTPGYLSNRLSLVVRSAQDMQAFEKELVAGLGPMDGRDLFQRIKGKDVVLIFVESYGRSAVEDPQYAGVILPRLGAINAQITAAGLHAVSGWVTSPTVGGLSWLAHGTLLSGLWVDSQARYDRLMISRQPSFNRLFSQAGWHSVAVMPAITIAWPEAEYFGYDQILSASGLQYRGKPFNWVTMPDQYTMSAFDRLALRPAREKGQKIMAEIALITSHAPWTPVPKLIDWDKVGDGSAFNDQAVSGDPPSVVWADPGRVRRQYIQTIDYSLATLGEFMARQRRDVVYVILGDHQPASIITGQGASRAVPVHIVSDDADLVSRFETKGFVGGMTPAPTTLERPMSDLRQALIDVFSSAP